MGAKEILKIAPAIKRCYGLSFLLLPINIFSTYYFQALLKPKASFIISVSRGLVISSVLIFILPLTNDNNIWLTMPFTEVIVAIFAIVTMVRYTKRLPVEKEYIHE